MGLPGEARGAAAGTRAPGRGHASWRRGRSRRGRSVRVFTESGLRLVTCVVLAAAAACSAAVPPIPAPEPTPFIVGSKVDATTASPVTAPTSSVITASPQIEAAPQGTDAAVKPNGDFCLDSRPRAVFGGLRSALATKDGSLLASLVDPVHGMDAQLLRNGTIVNYDQERARHLFQSDYSVDWGAAPGSGVHEHGSFRQRLAPDLLEVLTQPYSLACNELEVGGATYAPTWPYPGVNFFSLYVPGTQANGNLDWHTWAIGLRVEGDQMFLRALTQFRWEP